jgi:protein-S-isoprenylcysteine O-methyltransferase Ste14
VPNVLSFIGVVALFVALKLQVRAVEEPYLAHVHGVEYLDYASRVGRFLAGVGRSTSGRAARASSARLSR